MSKIKFADRVYETSASTGTGTLTLAGALTGYQTFQAVGDGETCEFVIEGPAGTWEVARGVYDHGARTLTRAAVLSSSNSGSLVDFAAGGLLVRNTLTTALLERLAGSGYEGPSGSAAAPGLALGNATSGLYFATDTLSVAIDGAQVVSVYDDASTRKGVGIGTATPGQNIGGNASHVATGAVAHVYAAAGSASLVLDGDGPAQLILLDRDYLALPVHQIKKSSGTLTIESRSAAGALVATLMTIASTGDTTVAGKLHAANFQTGVNAIAVGNDAVAANSSTSCGQGADAAEDSVAVGAFAGAADYSTGVGRAAHGGLTGTYNTAVGWYSMVGYDPGGGGGSENTALGAETGFTLRDGVQNVLLGNQAGRSLVDGSGNVLIGYQAGEHLSDPSDTFVVANGDAAAAVLLEGSFSTLEVYPAADNAGAVGTAARRFAELRGVDLIATGLTATAADVDELTAGGVSYPTTTPTAGQQLQAVSGTVASWTTPNAPGHVGLTLSRSSATTLAIAAGRIGDHEGNTLRVTSPLALDLTDSGDLPNGDSQSPTTWYHVLLGRIGATVVAGLSTTLAKPAAWDSWQQIGAMQTNATGSGEVVAFKQVGREFELQSPIYQANTGSPGTSQTTVRLWCPPGIHDCTMKARLATPAALSYLRIYDDAKAVAMKAFQCASGDVQEVEFSVMSDAAGELTFDFFGSGSYAQFLLQTTRFAYPIGDAT